MRFKEIELESDLYHEFVKIRYDFFFKDTIVCDFEDFIKTDKGKNVHHLACLTDDGLPIAYLRLTIDKHSANFSQFIVLPKYRGDRKVWRKLLDFAEQKCRKNKVVEITGDARLKYLPLYKRLGCEPFGDVFLSKKTNIPHRKIRFKLSYT